MPDDQDDVNRSALCPGHQPHTWEGQAVQKAAESFSRLGQDRGGRTRPDPVLGWGEKRESRHNSVGPDTRTPEQKERAERFTRYFLRASLGLALLLALVAAFLAPGDKLMLLGHEVPRAALWFGGGLGAGLLLPAAILWLLMTSVMVAIEMAQALIDFCKWLFKAGLVIAGLYGVFWLMSSL